MLLKKVKSLPPLRDQAVVLLHKATRDQASLRAMVAHPEIADELLGIVAQQAIETALKAVLLWHGTQPRRTHDLVELLDLLHDHGPAPPPELEETAALNPFAVEFRYVLDLTEDDPLDRAWALACVDRTLASASELLARPT